MLKNVLKIITLTTLQPALGFRHLWEHVPEVPEDKPENDAYEHHIPAELAEHRPPGPGCCC